MLSLAPNVRVYLRVVPTDMRQSFDGLGGLVRAAFGRDPRDGAWYLFVNKRRDRIKVLAWDRDGLAIWAKRLERGTFEALAADGDATVRELDATAFALLLAGVKLDAPRRTRFAG
jgi:transposase